MEAFREPAFQKSYVRAQQAAACTDQKSDYEILADLLVRRMINNKEDRYDKVAVDAAIQVVDKVAEDALLGLTVSLILMLFSPRKLLSDFDRLNKYLSLLPLDDLPNDRRWISHLSTLGLIQYDFGKTYGQEHYSSMFLKKSPMYANCGIATKEFPDDIYERLEKAKIVQFISNSILVPHELHPNYLRMNVRNGEKDLEDLIEGLAIQGDKKQISNALRYIYNCYFSDRKIDKEVEENLQKEIAKRKYLLKAVEWWDKREQYFYTREPGIALAYANMRRFDPIFDLANWL